jgi:hypothetical protein
MLRNLGFVISFALILLLNTIASVWAAEFGTERKGSQSYASESSGRS